MRQVDWVQAVEWLRPQLREEDLATGIPATGWVDERWILHALYRHPGLVGRGSHHDVRDEQLRTGGGEPDAGLDLDRVGTLIGIGLGYQPRLPPPWQRITWPAAGLTAPPDEQSRPPSYRWLTTGSLPYEFAGATEGSLDQASFEALGAVLSALAPEGAATECVALYGLCTQAAADLPEQSRHQVGAWVGPLGSLPELFQVHGGPYSATPSNVWPVDRSWFVWTDWDLSGTRVSGSAALMNRLEAHPDLETVCWPG